MSKRNTFILAVIIPLLVLLAMTIKPAMTLLYGKDILLETRAVDPNDLFRGDYVSLAFKISDIPKSMLPDSIKSYSKDTTKSFDLYVSLKQAGNLYVVDTVSEHKPSGGIYLKGKLQYYYNMPETLYIDYTLDKYFVQQGNGLELQNQSAKGQLVGKVKVFDGYGILTGVEPSSNVK